MLLKNGFSHPLIFIAVVLMAIMTACKSKGEEVFPDPEEVNKTYVLLNIESLSTRASQLDVSEKIKSLRIIVADTDNEIIEVNYKVSFADKESLNISNFQYYYTWETHPGSKKLYLIANEESVSSVSFQPIIGVTIPADTPTSLSEILSDPAYGKGSETGVENLVNILDAIYFSPAYQPDASNNIYLPYVSVYDKTIQEETATDEWKLYIVPVATKFTFLFNNYRPVPVYITNITVSSLNDSQFLFPRLGDDDLYKDFNGFDGNVQTDLYWIDWLAKVSQASQQYQDYYPNVSFNNQFGWISDYEMPTSSSTSPFTFAKAEENSSGFEIPEIQDEENNVPGVTVFGPFYMPESKYLKTFQQNENGTVTSVEKQIYYLTLGLSQPTSTEVPTFENVEIDNLKALFRNTDITIVVNMHYGDVEIYATISDWVEKSANGWVVKK